MRRFLTPKHAISVVALLLVAGASTVAGATPRPDTIPAKGTTPTGASPEAEALAGAASMTRTGRELYLRTRPTVDDRSTFSDHCPSLEAPDTYVLGCYLTRANRIYLLRIERPELDTGMAVTAAHEMLHAAYTSLGRSERRRVDAMTAKAFTALPDPRIQDELANYPARERTGELHSRLGTEVAELPRPLERYYATFFRDRSVVVAASAAYQHVFDDLEAKRAQLDADIAAAAARLDELGPHVDDADDEATRVGSEIDRLRAQGRIGESNALVGPQNEAVTTAIALTDEFNALVEHHNELVDVYNGLVLTNQQLVESLEPLPATA